MRRTIPLLATMALTLLMASGITLAAGVGSAAADSSVVGPGESSFYQRRPSWRHHHRPWSSQRGRDNRKNGIKLRGDDAVIEAPTRAKADSPARFSGPTAICVLGDFNPETDEVRRYVEDVSISGLTIRGFEAVGIDVAAARDATVTKIRAVGNKNGMGTSLSVGTKFLSNVVRDSGEDAIGLEQTRDVTISGNDVEGSSNSLIGRAPTPPSRATTSRTTTSACSSKNRPTPRSSPTTSGTPPSAARYPRPAPRSSPTT